MIQLMSVFMSIVVVATQTMSFQRFESQKINGRKLPWAMWLKKYRDRELRDFETEKSKDPIELKTLIKEDSAVTPPTVVEETENPKDLGISRQISTTPPLPPKNAHATPPPTPLRGVTIVEPLKIPDMPAPPRPDSTANNNAEVDTKLYKTFSFKLPKRTYSQKGLDEDDPIGRAIAFLWWFLFILPRIFSLALFYEFYPATLGGVLAVHYLLMLAYLFYYAKEYTATTFFINLWLGLVYIVSAIEYKIKFKYADRWLIVYYGFVMIQNTIFTLVWYFYSEWEGFYYDLIFYTIFGSMGLCVASTTVYYVLLKPKKRRVYIS